MLQLRTLFKLKQNINGIFCRRHISTASPNPKTSESYFIRENFGDLIARRQSEAVRSIVLEVNTKDVCSQVYHHCKHFGEIKNAFVYTLKDERNLMLLEYEEIDGINELQKFCAFQPNTVKWRNRILTVRNAKLNPLQSQDAPLQFDNVVQTPIATILRNADTFDDQVSLLYEHTRPTDLAVRLKFISALQAQTVINEKFHGFFPNAKIYPFGSTVNGFGKMGCDLDMVLRYDQGMNNSEKNSGMPLEFQGSEFECNGNKDKLRIYQVKCIASLIDHLVPGTNKVEAVGGARVPIIRYFDTNIHSSIDLSINNENGLPMTEFIYTMGLLDPRIRPFIFLVRHWAREFSVTRKYRDNFTNFHLTYMCISFLQQLNAPLVPTFQDVLRQIGISDSQNVTDIVNKGFIFDVDRIQFKTENINSVLELFVEFLKYFESFDFKRQIVTVRTLEKLLKHEPMPVFLENMFDPTSKLSLSENVSGSECTSMQIVMRETLEELQQCTTEPGDRKRDWGLLEIIRTLK